MSPLKNLAVVVLNEVGRIVLTGFRVLAFVVLCAVAAALLAPRDPGAGVAGDAADAVVVNQPDPLTLDREVREARAVVAAMEARVTRLEYQLDSARRRLRDRGAGGRADAHSVFAALGLGGAP